jgi:hypothetical protein
MSRRRGTTLHLAIAVCTVLAVAGVARAESLVVLPRPGQVGIGVQGGFGSLTQSGQLGREYGAGPSLAVRARYRMRYERAFGLSFEGQTFDVRVSKPADSLTAHNQLTLILSGVEIYQLFGTQTRTTKMLSAGIGIVQTSVKDNDGEMEYPGDGIYLSAGAGVERFFYRSMAFDLSTRYLAVFQGGKSNHDLQAHLGLIFYASY